jgi:DNA-binding MarR family transcriptional regulator
MPEHTDGISPASAEERNLMDALVQVSFAVMSALTRLGAPSDLSLTQMRVLAILRDREPRMAELAQHLGLDRSTISGLIDRAGKRGFVERVTDELDRRSSRVRLTPAGRELADGLADETLEVVQGMLADLAPGDRRALRVLLERTLSSPG